MKISANNYCQSDRQINEHNVGASFVKLGLNQENFYPHALSQLAGCYFIINVILNVKLH